MLGHSKGGKIGNHIALSTPLGPWTSGGGPLPVVFEKDPAGHGKQSASDGRVVPESNGPSELSCMLISSAALFRALPAGLLSDV